MKTLKLFKNIKRRRDANKSHFTIMSVFRLPGGQLISRGYVANFTQDINELCATLPRLTSEIPALIVKKLIKITNLKNFKFAENELKPNFNIYVKKSRLD